MPLIGESLDFTYFKQQFKASLEQFYIFYPCCNKYEITKLLTTLFKPSYDSDSVAGFLKLFQSLIVVAKKLNL